MEEEKILQNVLKAIEQADDVILSEIVKAVVRRNDRLHPESETVFLSLPREDGEERRRLLKSAENFLMKETR